MLSCLGSNACRVTHDLGQITHHLQISSVSCTSMTAHKSPRQLTRHVLAPGNFSHSVTCLSPMFYSQSITQSHIYKSHIQDCFSTLSAPAVPSTCSAIPSPHLVRSDLSKTFPVPSQPELDNSPLCLHSTFFKSREQNIPLSLCVLLKLPLCSQKSWVHLLTLPLIASRVVLGKLLHLHQLQFHHL